MKKFYLLNVKIPVTLLLIFMSCATLVAQNTQPAKEKTGVSIIITQSPKIIVKLASVTNNDCYGESKGAINIEPSGGYPPYRYHWTHGDSTQDIAALKAGKYRVAVYDGFSCSDTLEIEVTEPPAMETNVVKTTDILCYGYNNGEVDISVTGGKAPYSFNWSNGARTEDIKNVPSGSYSVLITDANHCQEIVTAEVNEKPLIVRSLDDVQNIRCAGDATGQVDITVGGGVAPYTFEWNNGSKEEDLRNLKAGVYEVTVRDAKGCTEVSSTKVIEPAPLKVSFDEVKGLRCFGDKGGAININVTGGKLPYQYNWNNGAATQDIQGVAAGDYHVKIVDNNGCSISGNTKVSEPPLLEVSLAELKDVLFFGAKNGSIDIDVKGGMPPYKYKWNNNAVAQDIANLEAGSYSVRVTDAGGCAKILNAAITQPTPLVVRLDNTINIACNGNKTGAINVSTAGGVAPYTYAWSNGATTEDLQSLAAGKYTLTVTDKNGLKQSVNATITEPPVFKASVVSTTNLSCFGTANGSIDIKAEGGALPYRYRWSNGQTGQDLTNIQAGDYSVKVMDANGCEIDLNATVTQPTAVKLTLDNVTAVSCNGQNTGAINLTTAGGTAPYKYAWNNGSTLEDLRGLKAGSYTVKVTDSKGCSETIATQITEPKVLSLSEGIVKQIDCKGNATGAISVNVAGGMSPYKYTWTSGDTTKNLDKIKAGAYSLRVTDANGCFSTFTKTITEPTKLVRTVDAITNILCYGDAKGAVNITVSGGASPYTYRWSNGTTTQDLVGVRAGEYSVKIKDANNCTDSVRVTVRENPVLAATTKTTNISCFGLKTGLVDLTVTGGRAPYRYQWTNGLRTQDVGNLAAGNYSVLVRDSAGCLTQADALIIEPPLLVASLQSFTDISCNGDKSGAVAVRVTGGVSPYRYRWNSGDSTANLANKPAGQYNLTVSDKNGCSQQVRATLSQPTKIDYSVKSVTNLLCFEDRSGAVDISVSGGVGPYQYKWNNGTTTQDLENVAAGKYAVQLTDANGCVRNLEAEITQPTDLIVKVENIVNIACFGNRTGSVSVSNTGGVPPYKYLWSNGATTQNIAQLPAGNYALTITDSKGCAKTVNAVVSQPPQLVAKLGDVTHIKCFGEKTGAIPLAVSGGATPYAFKWSNGSTEQNLTGVTAGTYTVVITDKNGCSQTLAATINQPTKLVSSVLASRDVTCFGEASGSINISVVGGMQPYQYAWSNGATSQDLTDVKAGQYKLTITDANGCKDETIAVTIKEPSLLDTKLIKVTDIVQYGQSTGAIDVSVTGGGQPYRYSWSNGSVSQDLVGVPGGSYSLKVTDANGCEKSVSATVNQPPPLVLKLVAVQDVKCADDRNGSISIDVTGGVSPYQYKWSNGDSTRNISNVPAGDYIVTVTDATGHKQILNTKIAKPSAIVAQSNLAKNPLCFGEKTGSIQVTVSGGQQPYQYAWSSGQTSEDLNDIGVGEYTLTVTDASGCKQTLKSTLVQPDALTAKLGDVKNLNCKGDKQGEVHVDVSGGVAPYKYSWSNGEKSKDIVGVPAGNYTLRVNDANGCLQNIIATVTEPAELTTRLANVVNNNCFGETKGSIQLDVSGGTQPYVFAWSNGESTKDISSLAVGEYSATITDSKGCIKNIKSPITGAPLLETKVREVVNIKCFGEKTGSVSVDVTGGTQPYSFSWNNSESKQNLVAVVAGDYQLTVKDAKGCTVTANAKVTQPAQLIAALDTIHHVRCAGESKGLVDISVTGGVQPYAYSWSNGAKAEDLINTLAGSYSVKVSDLNGCLANLAATVTEPAKLIIVQDSLVNVACSGQQTGKVAVHATGGAQPYSYLWNTGATASRVGRISAGEYAVTVADANGCKANYTAMLTEPRKLYKAIDAISDIRCGDETSGSIFVTVQEGVGPYTFKWNTGQTTEDLSNLPPGNYKLTITEANGCQSTLEANIEAPPVLQASLTTVTNIKCAGENTGAIDVAVSGGVTPYVYSWSSGAKTEDLQGVSADSYSLLVTDANNCIRTLQAEITSPEVLKLNIDSVRNVKCCGDASGAVFITVAGGAKPYSYKWSHGATSEDITNLTLGVYTVVVTDANGCQVSTPEEMSLFEQVVSKGMFSTRDILFDVAKATIKPQSFTTINKIATFMKEHPGISFSIEGHTDSDGDAYANQKLSEARAEAIRQALIKFGIRENRLKSKGYGESKPIATNLTTEGKATNRRVEFISLTGTLEGSLIETLNKE